MHKPRTLYAEGVGHKTAAQIAEMANITTGSVYPRVRKGQPVAGHHWRWSDATDHDTTGDGSDAGATLPGSHPYRNGRRIVCRCSACNGREWTVGEIRKAFPAIATDGMQISEGTIWEVNRLTAHKFEYADNPARGNWKPNGPGQSTLATCLGCLHDPGVGACGGCGMAFDPPNSSGDRDPWPVERCRITSREAYAHWQPVNPYGPGIAGGECGIPRVYAKGF